MGNIALVWALLLAGLSATGVVVADAISFHAALQSSYTTPWHSTSWLREPYTNAVLAFYPANDYWTMNAIKSERWRVRERTVGGVTFWTTLERQPITQ